MKHILTVLAPWTRQAEITVATSMPEPRIKIPEVEALHSRKLFEETDTTNCQLGVMCWQY